ncbi:MAG: hypothetical protein MUF83_10845 [Acidimicrobiales bacterium]|jgi:hypothetical protein|nr:hypothetical protein [Acidimicrobiales bacterium]
MSTSSSPPVIEFVPASRPPDLTPGAAFVLLRILRKEHLRITTEPQRKAA